MACTYSNSDEKKDSRRAKRPKNLPSPPKMPSSTNPTLSRSSNPIDKSSSSQNVYQPLLPNGQVQKNGGQVEVFSGSEAYYLVNRETSLQSKYDDELVSDCLLQDMMPDAGLLSTEDSPRDLDSFQVDLEQENYFGNRPMGIEAEKGQLTYAPSTSGRRLRLRFLPELISVLAGLMSFSSKAMLTPRTSTHSILSPPPSLDSFQLSSQELSARAKEGQKDRNSTLSMSSTSTRETVTAPHSREPRSPTYHPPPSLPRPCECLHMMASLLEDLESRMETIASTTLDLILASNKEALIHCNKTLRCEMCPTRSGNMTLLSSICEKLVVLCEHVINEYLHQTQRVESSAKATGKLSSMLRDGAAGFWQKAFLGAYTLDSYPEWDYLIRLLIGLQLRDLERLLVRMKSMASAVGRGARVTSLHAVEQRLRHLGALLRGRDHRDVSGRDEFVAGV